MASSSPNKSLIGRSAAILTTGEVAGASFDLNQSWGSMVNVDFSFTKGAIDNVTVRAYASMDDSTYDPITDLSGAAIAVTLTASAEQCFNVPALPGWKYFRISVQGAGSNTSSSSCAYTYRYLRRGSQ